MSHVRTRWQPCSSRVFLEEMDVLDPIQSTFRSNFKKETALVALMEDLRRTVDRGVNNNKSLAHKYLHGLGKAFLSLI